MESQNTNNSWNYHFHNESESHHGGACTTVNFLSHLSGFYHGNEEFQANDSMPTNKQARTTTAHYYDCSNQPLLLDSDLKPDKVSCSMDSDQQPSVVEGVGDHSKTNRSNNRHENDHSKDSDVNIDMDAPRPWTMSLGEETRHLESDRTNNESNQSQMPTAGTSKLVDDHSSFLPTLTYLDPNPIFVPPAGLCHGTSETSSHVGSHVLDAASTFNYQAPPDHSSFLGIRNEFATFDINNDDRITEIDFGLEQPCWGNCSSPCSHPCAPKPSNDSCQDPPRHFDGKQLASDVGPAIQAAPLHRPILHNAEKQSGPLALASVNNQDTAARPTTNMVFGVSQGAPMMMAPHLHVDMQQWFRVQQMISLNFRQLAQSQRRPNAAAQEIVVNQDTARSGSTNLPLVASLSKGGPTVQPDSSKGERDQQKKIAVTEDKKSEVPQGIPLSLPCDETRLSAYQTLIRIQFEFFAADSEDIQSGGQGRKKKLSLGQVGIRCIHCRHLPWTRRGHAAVYFPSTLEGVYQAAQNMAANHLCGSCHCIPVKLQEKLCRLRKEGTPSSARRNGKMYWAEACRAIGLVQTTSNGLGLKRTGAHRKQKQIKDAMAATSQLKGG